MKNLMVVGLMLSMWLSKAFLSSYAMHFMGPHYPLDCTSS